MFLWGENMKLLTINTHSLQVEDYETKLEQFVQWVLAEKPDIIAMQEASQTAAAEPIAEPYRFRQVPVPDVMDLRADNHAAQVAYRLNRAGLECHWVWLPIKVAYEKNDEGVAILSLGRPIEEIHWFPVSNVCVHSLWSSRAALGVRVAGCPDWFYTIHTGWWDAHPEPFQDHWWRIQSGVADQPGRVWLMGDFNVPAHLRNQGYDLIRAAGWLDTHFLTENRDHGITVPDVIDGWHERREAVARSGMRLDYIFVNRDPGILSSRVVLNGQNGPIVSDHFGMLVQTMPLE